MPPPFTSYTPAAGWEKAADHPISYPETGFEDLWARSTLGGITLPPCGLLAGHPCLSASQQPVTHRHFQLCSLLRDVTGVPAGHQARLATITGIDSSAQRNARQHLSRHPRISVLHCVHVRPHQRGDIHLLRAFVLALATLLAKLCLCA